uniref:Uncharacterized protein n=1 Tax=Vespula pensylvanica TaxID=30213 RepID=A0A834PDX0_VESPE|nr:hypothetical protein H0235_000323 [Vespula pensylvanica]
MEENERICWSQMGPLKTADRSTNSSIVIRPPTTRGVTSPTRYDMLSIKSIVFSCVMRFNEDKEPCDSYEHGTRRIIAVTSGILQGFTDKGHHHHHHHHHHYYHDRDHHHDQHHLLVRSTRKFTKGSSLGTQGSNFNSPEGSMREPKALTILPLEVLVAYMERMEPFN